MGRFYNSAAEADAAAEQGRLEAEEQRKIRAERAEAWAHGAMKARGAIRKIMSSIGKGKKPNEPDDNADDDCRDWSDGFDPKEWEIPK